MAHPQVVVFDLDGTLVDSRRDLAEAANRLIREHGGEPLSLEQVVGMVGEGVRILVERVLRAGCGTEAVGEPEVDRFRELYAEGLLRNTRPYPGIVELLERLHGQLPLAVLTNKPLQPARLILEGLGLSGHFATVVGGDGPLPRKPDPEALLALAGQLGGGQALLVGDSAVDLSTARAAAMPFALATWGFGGDALAPDLRHPDESLLPEPARLAALLGL